MRARDQGWVLLAGGAMGVLGSLLSYLGNPANSGICVSCFLESTAGALGLHGNARMQYLRPELVGFVLGSFGAAAWSREFRPRWRSAGLPLLGLGFLMILGSAVFVGCPIKAVLRLAAGDLTALPGLGGLAAGVALGIRLLDGSARVLEGSPEPRRAPALVPSVLLVAAAVVWSLRFVPGVLLESPGGVGALHAPLAVSTGVGLALGFLCQKTRFCVTGSLRDLILTRGLGSVAALGALLVGAAALNGFTGQFQLGYYDQPGSHLDWVWSFLGMGLVGIAAVVAGGCPFRQIIRAGEGDLDAAVVVAGMIMGAAVVQEWGLMATTAGVPPAGRVAVLVGLAALFSLGLLRGESSA